jgi:hypothetical protein
MRYKLHLALLLALCPFSIRAQLPDYTRQVVRSFAITKSTTVDITNKYGKVQVVAWNKDSVKFVIDLRIRAKDEVKMKRLKQSIDFEFTEGQSFLLALTNLGESGSDVFKEIVDIAGSYLSSPNSVVINYTVMVPAGIPLKIDNKFGNVFVENHTGSLNLVLSYGDFKCNRLMGKSQLKISSGDADINYIRDGQVSISYGNLHVREAAKLIAETRSSNINIDKASRLSLNSRRDKVFLGETGSLSGESYFSGINTTILVTELNYSCRYGDFTIDNIQTSFSMVSLSSEFTDLTLGFEKPPAFNFELTHQQDVTFVYPKSMAVLKSRVLNAADKMFITTGTFGPANADARVLIKALRRCNLTLSFK